MSSPWYLRALGCTLLTLAFVAAGLGQTTGDIRGVVKDPQGLAVPGAKITAVLQETGATRMTTSNATGAYEFPTLRVGHYTLRIQATGFKVYVDTGIVVTIGHVAVVNPMLQLGATTQEITTTAAAPLVETTSSQIGAVVNSRMVVQLPLNERNTFQLLQLQPGVQSPQSNSFIQGSGTTGMVSVNGGRARNNNFMVNGGDANDQFVNGPGVEPSPDTIQEFRVLTNTYNAEYGRNSGSIINVVTKSGTNAFHGDLYEFLRNDALDSRGFFDTSKGAFKMNQFGATLGGPIRKNKTFFFASYEGRRLRQGIPGSVVVVPTAAERQGNFSFAGTATPFAGSITNDNVAQTLNARPGCASASGAPIPLPSQSGGAVPYASIFPNNQIPAACFDPTALDLMNQFVPLPNIGSNEYQAVLTEPVWNDQVTGRIDQRITDRQQLMGYYYFNDSYQLDPWASFEGAGPSLPGFGAVNGFRYQQGILEHTWAINATTVNVFRFAAFREAQSQFDHPQHTHLLQDTCKTVPAAECFSDPSNPRLGITPGLGPTHEGVPQVSISGGFIYGNNFEGELPQIGNSFEWGDNFSKVIGSHTLKMGGGLTRQRFDQLLLFEVNGLFTFTGGGPNDVGFSNDLFPNYLLGLPDSFGQGGGQWENIRNTLAHLYIQDSWRARPSLTFNYGLRWELDTPLGDEGQRVQTFRPGQATQIFPCQLSPNDPLVQVFGTTNCNPGSPGESVFPLGLVVPGDKGISNGLTATYYKSFAPRIGAAWSPAATSGLLARLTGGPGKTSVRAGWGMFYNPMEQLVLEQFSAEPPFGGSVSLFNTLFNTPYEGQDGTISPNPFNGILNPPRGKPVDWARFRPILLFGEMPPHIRTQYADQYNLTIQRELTPNLVLEAAYVGSQGHRLLANYDLNNGTPQTCLQLEAIAVANPAVASTTSCGPFFEDSSFFVPAGAIPTGMTLNLPYGSVPSVTGPNNPAITLVGLRHYSSPYCQPTTGVGCPPDGVPVFSSAYSMDTLANSAYNSFQISLNKRFSHGLQFLAAYTWSKSLDDASTFEETVLPGCLHCRRSASLFNAPQVFVLSYYWQLPVPRMRGVAGRLADGWGVSGITTIQNGFPILLNVSGDETLGIDGIFITPSGPNWNGVFRTRNPRQAGCAVGTGPQGGSGAPPCQLVPNQYFNPNDFSAQPLGTIGSAPRTMCCGPGINNFDFALLKQFRLTESKHLEFRAEAFNIFNHAQFLNPDGNFDDGATFGEVLNARAPRLLQFALKLVF